MVVAIISSQISFIDIAIGFAAVAYVVSLLRDWRPIRALRSENSDLRAQLGNALERLDEQEQQIKSHLARIAELEKSRDFGAIFEGLVKMIEDAARQMTKDHERILERIDQHERVELEAWNEMNRSLGANTAVLSTMVTSLQASSMGPPPDAGTKVVETREVSHVKLEPELPSTHT